MSSPPAIRVSGLSKLYHVGARQQGYKTLRESIADAFWSPLKRLRGRGTGDGGQGTKDQEPGARLSGQNFWALKDVSFEVQPGEVVGIIGRNGAGKSTLLKILSRITEPTSGRIELRGRVGSLLEVGTGFHPELSGRENIYMNGSILGMSRREIAKKFDEIVAFAEVEDFLDTPVKRYSSGMYVRLAFAVAAHLEPEILIVDEVLAVGDQAFQRKCVGKMQSVASHGRVVLFVSHNIGLIHRLCNKAVLLHKGELERNGTVDEIIQAYLFDSKQGHGQWARESPPGAHQKVYIKRAWISGVENDDVIGILNCERPFDVHVEYEVTESTPNFMIGFLLKNSQGAYVFTSLDGDTASWLGPTRTPGTYRSICRIPSHLLAPGAYAGTVAAAIINQQTLDTQLDVLTFEVSEAGCIRARLNDKREGVITPVLDWRILGPGHHQGRGMAKRTGHSTV